MTVVIFARGGNIQGQVAQCREYARRKGYTVEAVIVGQGRDLPELIEGLGKKIDLVIVKHLSRLSRNMMENLQIQHELEYDCGVKVEVASDMSQSKAAGDYMRNIVQYVSDYE